ncbi:MAG: hypothetical protein HY906_17370 [Deltaproteobacteria bacterium]|nr:hypothetical protein [Deltaproteobacteria bacterium]
MDLYAFTQWLRARGLPESHLPVYRRGAESLLRDVGDAPLRAERIGELIHALTLDGATPRTIGNLQRIGEALLRFQEEGSAPTVPLPEPIEEVRPAVPAPALHPLELDGTADDDAFLPVAKPMPPPGEEPATVRRMRALDEPPAPVVHHPAADPPAAARSASPVPTVSADLPAAIEEEPVAPRAAPSDGELALDLGSIPPAAPPPRAGPAPEARPARPTGDLVRCPRCGRMQPRRAEGTCASCSTPFPHPIASTGVTADLAATVGRREAAPARRSATSRVLAALVFVAAGVVGAALGRHAVSGCVERLGARPVPAVGSYRTTHLDLTIDFPPGWSHLAGHDQEQTLQGIPVRTSSFARGERVSKPDHALQVAVLPLVGGFARAPTMRDDEFARFLDLSAHGAAKSLAGQGASWLGQGCEVFQRDDRRLGRCHGVAGKSGETWHMTTYLVLGTERVAFGVFGTQGNPEATRSESESIAASIRP